MASRRIPDLSFPEIAYGTIETRWDLRPLLYRGGAEVYARHVAARIADGDLGGPLIRRLPLVTRLHEHLLGRIAEGARRQTVAASIGILRNFFTWMDAAKRPATLASIEDDYIEYSEYLLHRVRAKRDLRESSAYAYAINLAVMLDSALDLKAGVLAKTRLMRPKVGKAVLGTEADKQNLERTMGFGHALVDITDALTAETIRGPIPVTIHLRTGHSFDVCCRLRQLDGLKMMQDPQGRRVLERRRQRWAEDTSARTRYPLINLRIEAELLIFIAQSGMNLTQAIALEVGDFRYQSHVDGYRVYRIYKGRRLGEVEFTIYSEYREHLERYMRWRGEMVANASDTRMFPFVLVRGAIRRVHSFSAIQDRFGQLGLPVFLPRDIRNTRVNWMLRRTKDPQLTAEMHQHSREVLLRVYDKPHHQTALVEISRFLSLSDQAISMPGPGACSDASPTPIDNIPPNAPLPDCVSPAGCLFCTHQRDIDTDDHVWSLASFRHLKSLELGLYRPPASVAIDHPAKASIDRITAKLEHIAASSKVRSLWVDEALARIDEGHYHPTWDGYIQLLEIRSWE